MKVILLKDVPKVGLKNEVKEVSNGYAQNFLIKRGLAEIATARKMEIAEKHFTEQSAKKEEDLKKIKDGLAKLKGDGLIIGATANEKGHLFEAVNVSTIAEHFKDIIGVDVNPKQIIIAEPIKEIGEHVINIEVDNANFSIPIKVEGN